MIARATLAAIAASALLGAAAAQGDAGERLYREGILPGGAALQGESPEGTPLSGAEGACARCHRRSGFGGGEGRTIVPPLPPLFGAERSFYLRAQPVGSGRPDPRYDGASLARALRDGVTPDGRRLASPMPRYEIDEAAASTLAEYLLTLAPAEVDGITDDEIRLATVLAPGAPAQEARAMLEVMNAFIAEHNASSRKEGARRRAGSDWMSAAFRRWTLETWTLEGPPATWRAQLQAQYRRAPVFAVVGGSGASWAPVEAFCESEHLPCLFPLVAAPASAPRDYTFYFTGGPAFEARILAHHLRESGVRTLLQVRPAAGPGAEAAAALRADLVGIDIVDLSPSDPVPDLDRARDAWVLWTDAAEGRAWLPDAGRVATQRYVSGSLWGAEPPPGVRSVSTFDAPSERARRIERARAWLDSRALGPPDAVRCNTLFTMMMMGEALTHLGRYAYRERLVERIEHMASRTANVSWYPRPALGPGQRVASKGGYVMESRAGAWVAVGEWIVP